VLEKLKTFWTDPVWSKVISAAFIAAAVALYQWGRVWLAYAVLFVLFIAVIWYWASKRRRLQAKLRVSIDENFPHVAIVTIDVHNLRRRPAYVSAVEFVTREHWEMPDPLRRGYTSPVVKHLPEGSSFIRISTEKGSTSSKAIGETLGAGRSLEILFRLVTDNAPNYGFGIFPFHLSTSLVYGQGHRLLLPDVVVSLHGSTTLASTTFSEPMPFVVKPGDRQNFANAALSKIGNGAICAPEILNALKQAAHA
jgi:hypothetical protein